MQLSHKIKLDPNKAQSTYLSKSTGVARFAFNWGLAEWKRQYEAGEKPSAYSLKKQFNAVKREQFPFVTEVSKTAAETGFMNLEKAFKNFFRRVKSESGKPGYPNFKKKGIKDSFYTAGSIVRFESKRVKLPVVGWVRMRECLRFQGKIQSVVISKKGSDWYVAVNVDIPDGPECCENQAYSAVGIDLGLTKLATLSDGTVFENPKTTLKFAKRLRRANKSLARKKKGSSNWKKQKARLQKLHEKIRSCRLDSIHKFTSFVADNYSDVCLEDLNVTGMVKNRRLAKSVSDAAFYEIRRQLNYKVIRVHVVDRFFPSSKLCMNCGTLHEMPLSKRTFECDCGVGPLDRDLHAAQNILRQGLPKN